MNDFERKMITLNPQNPAFWGFKTRKKNIIWLIFKNA